MPDERKKPTREKDDSFSKKLFSSKTGQLQELVNTLVSNYRETSRIPSKTGITTTLGGHDLDLYDIWLAKAHTYFREASNQELTLT
ncbi:MAG: hypothetical protein WCF08_06975, partial [Anaerolineaceae bacterium]